MSNNLAKSGLKQGPVSEDQMMKNLVNARKVMKKVNTGEFTKGHINEDLITSDPNEIINNPELMNDFKQSRQLNTVSAAMNEEKIKNSGLPDSIKDMMLKNPPQNISLNDNGNVDLFAKAKRLMEQEHLIDDEDKKPTKKVRSFTSQRPTKQVTEQQYNGGGLINESTLAVMVENSVRKILNEIFDKKLDQILAAKDSKSINENLVLRVGDSIFSGKITNVKQAKKK